MCSGEDGVRSRLQRIPVEREPGRPQCACTRWGRFFVRQVNDGSPVRCSLGLGGPWIRHVRRSMDLDWPDDTTAVAGAGPNFTSSISDDDTLGICWFCVSRATVRRVPLKTCSAEPVEELISSRSAEIRRLREPSWSSTTWPGGIEVRISAFSPASTGARPCE